MKRFVLLAAAVAALSSGVAMADLQSNGASLGSGQYIPNPTHVFVQGVNVTLEAAPLGSADVAPSHAGNDMFRAIAGPYAGFAAGGGVLGFDDYQGISPPGDEDNESPLEEFGFVGGVTAIGMTLQFQFYDAAQNFRNSFDITFSQAGNFIWTLTNGPDTHPPFSPAFFDIPNSGYVQVVAADGSTGQWFLSTTVPSIGTESRETGEGSLTTHSHRFRLDVPEPATLALLGISGLAMIRRRR